MQSCAKYGNIVSWFFETIFHILCGALAQLGAHHTGSVGVRGSNPLCSTILNENPEFLAISGFFHTATEVHLHDFVFILRTFSGFHNNIACFFIQFLLYWERIQDIDVDCASDACFIVGYLKRGRVLFSFILGYILRVQILKNGGT